MSRGTRGDIQGGWRSAVGRVGDVDCIRLSAESRGAMGAEAGAGRPARGVERADHEERVLLRRLVLPPTDLEDVVHSRGEQRCRSGLHRGVGANAPPCGARAASSCRETNVLHTILKAESSASATAPTHVTATHLERSPLRVHRARAPVRADRRPAARRLGDESVDRALRQAFLADHPDGLLHLG